MTGLPSVFMTPRGSCGGTALETGNDGCLLDAMGAAPLIVDRPVDIDLGPLRTQKSRGIVMRRAMLCQTLYDVFSAAPSIFDLKT